MEATSPVEKSSEELDQVERSNKKPKGDSASFLPQRQIRSYKDSLVCPEGIWEHQDSIFTSIDMETVVSDDEVEIDDQYPTILLSKEEKLRIQAPWRSALIIKAIGKSVGFKYMDFKIRSLWKPQGDMQIIDLGLDFFLVRFKLSDDYWNVVNGGPWFIKQQFLSVRCWSPGFRPPEAKITTTAVWVRLPELPIELYDSGLLRRIGNQLGKLLKIDARTADSERGRYARICIQIDIDQPLTPIVRVGDILQKVQYEGISAVCFECGCVGHRITACPLKVNPNNNHGLPRTTSTPPSSPKSFENGKYGDWMLVTRKKIHPGNKKTTASSSTSRNATRHTVHGGNLKAGKIFQTKSTPAQSPTHWVPPASAHVGTSQNIAAKDVDMSMARPADTITPTKDNLQVPKLPTSNPRLSDNLKVTSDTIKVLSNLQDKLAPSQTVASKAMPLTSKNVAEIPLDMTPQNWANVLPTAPIQPLVTDMDLESTSPLSHPVDIPTTLPNIRTPNRKLTSSKISKPPQHGSSNPGSSSPYPTPPPPLPQSEKPERPAIPTTSPNPSSQVNHSVSEQLGNSHEGAHAPYRRCTGELVTTMSKSVLAKGRGGDGTIIKGPDPTTSTEYAVWPNHCQPLYRPSYSLSNDATATRTSTSLERTEDCHQGTASRQYNNVWNRDDIRAERCRSPRSFDVHHLSGEHSAFPSFSGESLDSHCHRSSSESDVLHAIHGSDSGRDSSRRFIPSGTQPTNTGCSGDLSGLSSSRGHMETEGATQCVTHDS
ncbi:hypothetical protein FCV25MIE_14416 [Fagus crenata]